MKIQCPKCKVVIPSEQINIATDLAFCPGCNEAFNISETMCKDGGNANLPQHIPKGAWIREEINEVIFGATTRSPVAFFLVPFMCVWSGGSLGGIYGTQIIKGEFSLESSLFGIPFVLGSIIFWAFALMAICGKVEVTIGKNGASVFTGVGSIGWNRKFNWESIKTIREQPTAMNYPGGYQSAIILEGQNRLKFGTGLNEERRYFVLNVLKYLKATTH